MNLESCILETGRAARRASALIARSSTADRNAALLHIADAVDVARSELAAANALDLDAGRERGLNDALLDRLTLTAPRIDSMLDGLRQVAELPDPIGEVSNLASRPAGIQVGRMRVPLGVIGIIYESRPNVTVDAAALCLKSGNATILRGGSEAIHSNLALAGRIRHGLVAAGLPADAVQLIDTTDRAAVGHLLAMDEYVDVIVPRGGKGLIERVMEESRIPVIKHLDGICHVYIDDHADHDKAVAIALNSKTQRYAVCNAMETLLVAASRSEELLPELAARYQQAGVEIRGCERTRSVIGEAVPADEADWRTEYLAPILSIRTVDGIDAAIEHINLYGSQHTDAIVTEDYSVARRFLREVDSSSVLVNASTRFADGFQYGLGAEIGISTDKLHARGPVALEGLTSQKFVVFGEGQVLV